MKNLVDFISSMIYNKRDRNRKYEYKHKKQNGKKEQH